MGRHGDGGKGSDRRTSQVEITQEVWDKIFGNEPPEGGYPKDDHMYNTDNNDDRSDAPSGDHCG